MSNHTKHNASPSAGSQPESSKTLPFRRPSPEELLRMLGFGGYLKAPPLNLTVICDSARQKPEIVERMFYAGNRFYELLPSTVQPRAVAQRFFDVEEIHDAASIENASAETTNLSLLVLFCKVEPVDLVLGIGGQGQALVTDLKREAAKMYPTQTPKFVTQTELEQEAKERLLAKEVDAFMLVALERIHKTKVAEYSSNTQ